MFFSGYIYLLVLLFIFFFVKGLSIDPDFGLHLRLGEYIKTRGIFYTDPFSYSMPSYRFVHHEWFIDAGMARVYPFLGIAGLAFVASIVGIASLMLQISPKEKYLSLALLLSGATLFPIIGARPLVMSWLFFSLLLVTFKNKKIWHKWRWGLPVLFLVWANTHGSFPLGIAVLALKKRFFWSDIGIVLASVVVTFINPYGWRLWQEVWITLSVPEIHFILVEWYPIFLFSYFPLWILIILSMFLVFRYRKRYSLMEKGIFFFLLIVGAMGVRNIPYWVIFSLPLTARGVALLKAEAGREGRERFLKGLRFLTIFAASVIVLQNVLVYQRPYPEDAVRYLRKNIPKGNVFADFNWGGYLAWKLPEKKIFVDGMMTVWRQHDSKTQESESAFVEFFWVANRVEGIEYLASKYEIDTLLLTPVPFQGWDQQDFNLFGIKEKKKYPEIMTQLREGGWKAVYRDSVAVIYQKK